MKSVNILRSFFLMAVPFALIACGDDSSSGSDDFDSETETPSSSSLAIYSSNGGTDNVSSATISSSSAEKPESSSLEGRNPCAERKASWSHLNPGFNYAEFVDERDNQCYKTTSIAGYEMMSENLNYADSVALPVLRGATHCRFDQEEYCESTGRLYTWDAAMVACPEGWRIPSTDEISKIFRAAHSAAEMVTLETPPYPGGEITDAFGISIVPTGIYYADDPYMDDGDETLLTMAALWLSDGDDDGTAPAFLVKFGEYVDYMLSEPESKKSGIAVRCIRD